MKLVICFLTCLLSLSVFAQQEDSLRLFKKKTNSKKLMIAGILTTAGGLIVTGIGTSMMNNPNTNDNKSFPVLMTGLMTVPVGAILTTMGGIRTLHFKRKLKHLNMNAGLTPTRNFGVANNQPRRPSLILTCSFKIQ